MKSPYRKSGKVTYLYTLLFEVVLFEGFLRDADCVFKHVVGHVRWPVDLCLNTGRLEPELMGKNNLLL